MQETNPYLLTLPELLSAKKKISRVSAHHDPEKTSFKGFECLYLDPTEFREQLKRTFLIVLSDGELGALVTLLDTDKIGKVASATFINEFLRLGKIARDKEFTQVRVANERIIVKKKKFQAKREEIALRMIRYEIPKEWSVEEEESAQFKFGQAALSYDSSGNALGGFTNGGSLNYLQFHEQLKRNFQLFLTSGEVAALVNIFDTNGDGEIDCSEFLHHFFRIGTIEREKLHVKHTLLTNRLHAAEKVRKKKVKEKFEKSVLVELKPDTKEDKKSLKLKIRQVAECYERKLQWGNVLIGFEGASLTPTQFKEQLKNIFLVFLSPGELSAAVKLYGNEDGDIDCGYFLSTFFIDGKNAKNARSDRRYEVDYRIKKENDDYHKGVEEKYLDRKKTHVQWPVLPQINDNGSTIASSTCSLGGSEFEPDQPKRMRRKASVMDSLNSNRAALEFLSKNSSDQEDKSMATIFTNASDSTKDFIRELEKEEAVIESMDRRTKKTKKKVSPRAESSTATTA